MSVGPTSVVRAAPDQTHIPSRKARHRRAAPRGIARFDSAAGMAQALGRSLHGEEFRSLSNSRILDRAVLPAVNLLPRRPREWFYALAGATEAIGSGSVGRLDVAGIADWLTGLYPDRRYPACFIGSSNGAMVHLAAALGVPWLPQTFLCPVRNPGADPDAVRQAFTAGTPTAERLAQALPDMAVHHMHDPNQDRLMLQTMSYFRLKHRRLPAAYRDALVRWLPAGATLFVVNCTRTWPVTRTGARSVFQFGALGGATAEEYFQGSERTAGYFQHYGRAGRHWDAPAPDDRAPEAEWGFDTVLLPELEALSRERDWRLRELRFEEPEDLSTIAARLHEGWYGALGEDGPQRLVVESFVLMAPERIQRLRAIPYWLLFAVQPSADRLRRFLDSRPAPDEVDIMLFSHGTDSIGLAPVEEWRELAGRGRRPGRLLGVDPRRYPRDFAAFARFHRDLETLGRVGPRLEPLPLDRFEALLMQHLPGSGVELVARAGR